MSRRRIAIIGASLAGATAAASLRHGGFDGELELIGAEAQLPYNRPPLSKGYLRGQERFEDQLVNPSSSYAEQEISLRLGVRATEIGPARKIVRLDRGEEVPYDQLLVATGARNRQLTVPSV
jgi:3-phenylpropionate/trans-cinnamate dioxygenase ferredoxin reductase component